MQYSQRIQIICKHLPHCTYFADIGCDHGYCTDFMLKNSLCKGAVIADVSAKSLENAEKLLAKYLKNGKLESICTNGLENIDQKYQTVLIAGMGGEECVSILQNGYLPQTLILQPMKNTPKVRKFLLQNGYILYRDFTFFDKKFYDLICATRDIENRTVDLQLAKGRVYDKLELAYGYDNIHGGVVDFVKKIELEIEKYKNRASCKAVQEKLKELQKVEYAIKRDFSNT